MKKLAIALALTVLSSAAYAESCKVTSAEKKLAGAAMNSFMKKCETDAKKACDASAAEEAQRRGQDSFTKKCVTDAIGLKLSIDCPVGPLHWNAGSDVDRAR